MKDNEIARLSLGVIFFNKFKKVCAYSLNYSAEEINIRQEVSYLNQRNEQDKNLAGYQYKEYFLFALELGLRPIGMSPGTKSLAQRIVDFDFESYNFQYREGFTSFSHIVEIEVKCEEGVTENREITVYEVSPNQWAELANLAIDFWQLPENRNLKKKKK